MENLSTIRRLFPILIILTLFSCEPEDTTQPVVDIINPLNDLTVFHQDTVSIHIEASDNDKVKEVKLLLDDRVIFSTSTKPYIYNLSCEGLDGNRIIKASAIDISGNIGESRSRILKVVKNENPIASFSILPEYGVFNQEIRVNASASSDNEDLLENLQFRWDWNTDGIFDTEYSSSIEQAQTYTEPGIYNITLEVKDGYDNTDQAMLPVIIKGLLTDKRDGKSYKTVIIGKDTWFAENLNYSENGWCYEEKEENCTEYGRLYTWEQAANNCPEGWHLSTDEDWKNLERELGMEEYLLNTYANRGVGEVGKKIKSKTAWSQDQPGTDEYGFNALPAGVIDLSTSIDSKGKGVSTSFFNSIEFIDSDQSPLTRMLRSDNNGIVRLEAGSNGASSARCVKGVSHPILINPEIIESSYTAIRVGCDVLRGGGDKITETGLCWSAFENPTIEDNHIILGSEAGYHEGRISGLEPNQSYYIRAYAKNNYNIGYGKKLQVSTLLASPPKIQKLGTIDIGIVETSPVVFKGKLYRFEYIRQKSEHNPTPISYFHFIDHETGDATPPFGQSYHLASAFVYGDSVYVTASNDWGGEKVFMYVSADLINWERRQVLNLPGAKIFNTSICEGDNQFVLMYEIGTPIEEAGQAFTARFAISDDLIQWEVTPPECNYSKDHYTAGHALRFQDGYYYNFYLKGVDNFKSYETYVVRSSDLINWNLSPLNPVLKASDDDKKIANPDLSPYQRNRILEADNFNNSDIDFCEYNGKVIINYSWGNQLGVEFLAEAIFEGTLKEFLEGWFIY